MTGYADYGIRFPICLTFTIAWGVLCVCACAQTARLCVLRQVEKRRGLIHAIVVVACVVGMLDNGSRLVRDRGRRVYALCYFPTALIWYFIYTAYMFAIIRWIEAYKKGAVDGTSRRVYAFLYTYNAAMLAAMFTDAGLFCSEGAVSSISAGDVLLVLILIVTFILVAAMFLVYGIKITRTLEQGLLMQEQNTKTNRIVYKITKQTTRLSCISVVGMFLGILFVALMAVDYVFEPIGTIVNILMQMVMCVQMLYMLRPKSKKVSTRTPEVSELSQMSVGVQLT